MRSEIVHLNKNDVYDIGGVLVTLDEIQQAVIDSKCYKDLISHIQGGK